ncbi:hypothetical protein [Yoonia maritima]|uniref:hypothetical protein n=1 Tax=Yoonia maritima TaxID=1435347 RepID=UPI0013A653F9|nr:hypothetical protein [Yoonia maritima]
MKQLSTLGAVAFMLPGCISERPYAVYNNGAARSASLTSEKHIDTKVYRCDLQGDDKAMTLLLHNENSSGPGMYCESSFIGDAMKCYSRSSVNGAEIYHHDGQSHIGRGDTLSVYESGLARFEEMIVEYTANEPVVTGYRQYSGTCTRGPGH